MKLAIVGARGQLGSALQAACSGHAVSALGRPEIDITRPDSVSQLLELAPRVIVLTAAMTNVDGAARDPDLAFRINALGTRNIALAARELGADLLYVSTNEVFPGDEARAYGEWDATRPVNAYGASKLAGETFVRQLVPNHYIVRTAWIFGGPNSFVTKMLELAASRQELTIVDDEVSNPTYAPDLAAGIARLIETGLYGTYHLTNAGVVSRYEYALEIFRQAGVSPKVTPIKLRDYQRASTPPPYAPLRNFVGAEAGIVLRPWQEAVAASLSPSLQSQTARPSAE
jgi:dTDP-4-dehydrorhamnose reductase